MDYLLDVHTHTIASGHAYNTIMEMAKAGFDKGLKLLGITEHAPMMPGTCHAMYFHNLKVVPITMCGIELKSQACTVFASSQEQEKRIHRRF